MHTSLTPAEALAERYYYKGEAHKTAATRCADWTIFFGFWALFALFALPSIPEFPATARDVLAVILTVLAFTVFLPAALLHALEAHHCFRAGADVDRALYRAPVA